MQNDLSATEQEEFRIRCRSALDGLETLLQSLLEISKMETGLIQMNKKKLPLMDTVISAVNRTYPKADEKEIEFVFDYEKELETCRYDSIHKRKFFLINLNQSSFHLGYFKKRLQ